MYPVIQVSGSEATALEQLGTKRKFWYEREGVRWLFKAEERGTGEDWAEKVVCELAAVLGLPHVHYELAMETGSRTPGVVCANLAGNAEVLLLGNELLLVEDEAYPAHEYRKYKVSAHTVDIVSDVLGLLQTPPAPWSDRVPPGASTARGIFSGYLLLDAWAANQDRHHENWGAVLTAERFCLAPTFDHGASLARNLSDEERHERMTTRDSNRRVPAFARRARSAFYGTADAERPLTTLEAWRKFSEKVPDAAILWLDRLREIGAADIDGILRKIPPNRMSQVCKDFTKALLLENQSRLLTGEEDKSL